MRDEEPGRLLNILANESWRTTDFVNASATSSVSYTTSGSAPNRRFIVQWSDCDHYNNGQQNHISFQVVLNETTNTVQVVYGPITMATTFGPNTCSDVNTESGNVGLLGTSTADYNLRKVTNGTHTWAATVPGEVISDVCNLSPTNVPVSGLTFTWTPPPTVPMVFNSCTTTFANNGQVDARGSQLNAILRLNVVKSSTPGTWCFSVAPSLMNGCRAASMRRHASRNAH